MRALLVAGLILAAAAAAPAGAASLPTLGTADGVTATPTAIGVDVRLTGAAAQAAAPYAGRTLWVECAIQPGTGLAFVGTSTSASSSQTKVVRAADGTLSLKARLSQDAWDTCEVKRPGVHHVVARRGPFAILDGPSRPPLARVGMTAGGVAWIDELGRAVAMDAAMEDARRVRPSAVLTAAEATAAGLAVLPDEAASPPPGTVGYWTDGVRKVEVVGLSAAGRRLVVEVLDATTARSNVGRLTNDVAAVRRTPTLELQLSSADRDATPSPLRHRSSSALPPVVPSAVQGARLSARFAGQVARRRLRQVAGRRVSLLCGPAEWPADRTDVRQFAELFQRVTVRVPRRGTVLRAPLRRDRPADVCALSDDGHVVATTLPTAAGRAVEQDFNALSIIYGIASTLAGNGATRYPSAASIAAKDPKWVVALSDPAGALEPGGRAGVWTDGTRAVVAVRSASGRRLVIADEGDGVLRDNTSWLFFVGLPLNL